MKIKDFLFTLIIFIDVILLGLITIQTLYVEIVIPENQEEYLNTPSLEKILDELEDEYIFTEIIKHIKPLKDSLIDDAYIYYFEIEGVYLKVIYRFKEYPHFSMLFYKYWIFEEVLITWRDEVYE